MTGTPRVGVVGAGSLGFHHIRILRDLPDIQFTGFFENRPERKAEVEKELRVRGQSSLEALLEASDAAERGRVLTSLLAMGRSVGKGEQPHRMN